MDHPLDNPWRSQGSQGFKASEAYHEFKEIKMEEDKSFDEFYAKLKDIVNSSFNLAETILEPKIAKMVLNLSQEISCKDHRDLGIEGYWQNSFARSGWQSIDLWVGFDKDRDI